MIFCLSAGQTIPNQTGKGVFAAPDYKALYFELFRASEQAARLLHEAQQRAQQLYRDQTAWNRMSLVNIAGAGRFAADRAIRDYAGNIWHASPVPPVKNLSAKKPEK